MKRLPIAGALALLLLGSPAARAAVVHEEVGSQSDLPIDLPYPLLALGPGTNSVIGGTSFSGDAVDSFAFSIPVGSTLMSISYSFTSSAFIRGDGSITEATSGFLLVRGDGSAPLPGAQLAAQNVDMIPGLCSPFVTPCGPTSPSAVTVTLFASAPSLSPGVYAFEQRALTVNAPESITWNSSYRVDLVLAPEPASLALFAPGLTVLAGIARRRRRSGSSSPSPLG